MRYAVIGMMLVLGGCGWAQLDRAKKDYDASRIAFKECVAARPLAQCEGQRQAMNADARAFAALKGNSVGVEFSQ